MCRGAAGPLMFVVMDHGAPVQVVGRAARAARRAERCKWPVPRRDEHVYRKAAWHRLAARAFSKPQERLDSQLREAWQS